MISTEIKAVVAGEYCNPKLDRYMDDLLLHSILNLDMSAYMKARQLRSNVICDRYYEKFQEQNNENEIGFGL